MGSSKKKVRGRKAKSAASIEAIAYATTPLSDSTKPEPSKGEATKPDAWKTKHPRFSFFVTAILPNFAFAVALSTFVLGTGRLLVPVIFPKHDLTIFINHVNYDLFSDELVVPTVITNSGNRKETIVSMVPVIFVNPTTWMPATDNRVPSEEFSVDSGSNLPHICRGKFSRADLLARVIRDQSQKPHNVGLVVTYLIQAKIHKVEYVIGLIARTPDTFKFTATGGELRDFGEGFMTNSPVERVRLLPEDSRISAQVEDDIMKWFLPSPKFQSVLRNLRILDLDAPGVILPLNAEGTLPFGHIGKYIVFGDPRHPISSSAPVPFTLGSTFDFSKRVLSIEPNPFSSLPNRRVPTPSISPNSRMSAEPLP